MYGYGFGFAAKKNMARLTTMPLMDVAFRPGSILPAAISFSRASTKYAQDSNGVYQEFAANQPAITDKGLLIEPSAENLVPYSTDPSMWDEIVGTVESASGDYLGIFNNPAKVASTGGTWNRARSLFLSSQTDGDQFTCTFFYIAGTSGRARIVVRKNTAGTESILNGLVGSLSTLQELAGTITELTQTSFTGGGSTIYKVSFIFTLSGGDAIRFAIGPDSAVSGEDVVALGCQIEKSAFSTSFIETTGASATRSADSMDIELPSGTHDLVFTFDDGSTQTVSGQTGTYSIPTNLDRPFIRSLQVW